MPSGARSSFMLPLVLCALVIGAITAAEAVAQVVGQPFTPLSVVVDPEAVQIGVYLGPGTLDRMNANGVTLFAAAAPNGPILARIVYTGPFDDPGEGIYVYSWLFPGVPPGTYYVTVILGVVGAPNTPADQWAPVVVSAGCTTAPGAALVNREVASGGPNAVQIRLAASGGCATSFLVDVGITPGAANVTSFEQPGGVLAAAAVPAGAYYVRARGRNALGIGAYSTVLPVSVPACTTIDSANYHLTALVAGSQVTLSWTPGPTPPGGPVTFYELALATPNLPVAAWPRVLLPASTTSVTASLPAGPKTVMLIAGNACGSWSASTVAFTMP